VVDYAWPELMRPWNAELLADAEIRELLGPEVVASGWLGFPGATEDEIAAAEARLGTPLPESYRQFLQYSNGWRWITPFIEQLWSTSEVDHYAARHQDLIDAWRQGRSTYGAASQSAEDVDDQELSTAIEVSDVADGVLLLNPRVRSDDGEWEAWFFAAWLPGATRYRSFWELMHGERERYRSLR
jgi:hypothetical protein